jgi:methylenetetrahydrofolate reductase (NADPH)
MKIKELFNNKKTVISFEIFPPNSNYHIDSIYKTIDSLSNLNPDFISVTYGSGGSTRKRTVEIASIIKNNYNIEALAHLTCIGADKKEIDNILRSLKQNNIENILALRGDLPLEEKQLFKDFTHANELINYINKDNNFGIASACYPEFHHESNDILDLWNLKKKVDSGTDFLITQIFFDNDILYRFLDNAQKININIPISAGIMPVLNKKQILRITKLCGSTLPKKFLRILEKYEYNEEALEQAGIAYALEQIVDLLSYGIDGIHFYTMNRIKSTEHIINSISNIRSINNE